MNLEKLFQAQETAVDTLIDVMQDNSGTVANEVQQTRANVALATLSQLPFFGPQPAELGYDPTFEEVEEGQQVEDSIEEATAKVVELASVQPEPRTIPPDPHGGPALGGT